MKIKNRRIDPAFMDWKTIFKKIWYNVYKKVGNNLLTPIHISFVICVWKSKRENINYIYYKIDINLIIKICRIFCFFIHTFKIYKKCDNLSKSNVKNVIY